MVVVPAGRFRMGCLSQDHSCFEDELPVRAIRIGRPFALSVHEVTFEDYDRFDREKTPSDAGSGRGRRPANNVSWHDAQAYAVWLSEQTGERYRLPTEAEWEYAARAGSETKYTWGDVLGPNQTNCMTHHCGEEWVGTAPVGSFAANAFGLHDMHGNVFEWVQDCWNDSHRNAPSDGGARLEGDCSWRIARGGSYFHTPRYLRSALRYRHDPARPHAVLGFRIARAVVPD